MSLTNPNTVVTEERLSDFYKGILPYLGGTAEAGFTPVGTVISVMGKTAPANYLACDGSVYNISDYPELANYFKEQFGSSNYFGGDGTTTFGIVDLSGEFLRGAGTNSHSGQGSGAEVGEHQNATKHWMVRSDPNSNLPTPKANTYGASEYDKLITSVGNVFIYADDKGNYTAGSQYTSRPTNTSVLFCIATKNIFLNPSLDYSTDEKVVGTWFDGKTLYQKTVIGTISVDTDQTSKNTTLGNVSTAIDTVVSIDGIRVHENKSVFVSLSVTSTLTNNSVYVCNLFVNNSTGNLVVEDNRLADDGRIIMATVKYTKTTS